MVNAICFILKQSFISRNKENLMGWKVASVPKLKIREVVINNSEIDKLGHVRKSHKTPPTI